MAMTAELVRSAQKGDLEAFSSLVKRYQDMAFTVAYVQLEDETLAEDAAQESFIEAYLHLESLREPAAFGGWLRRIVQHRCNRIVRRRTMRTLPIEEAFDLPAHDPGPAEALIGREAREVLHRAIQSLPEHERTAILLHYISGYTQNEIADFLEVPAATLRKRLQSARERLKERIMTTAGDYFERRPSQGETFGRIVRFFIAVRTGNEREVRDLLTEDSELTIAREGWSETLAQLYPRGRPTTEDREALKERDQNGWSPLHWAVWGGWTAVASLLIEHGAHPDSVDWRGVPSLVLAARGGDAAMASMLLDRGADPNGGDAPSAPLHAAAAAERTEIIALLLERGADIERRDRYSRTPLHWGATAGHRNSVETLLEKGAKADVIDARGHSPYWWADHSGHVDVAELLAQWSEGSSNRNHHQQERRAS